MKKISSIIMGIINRLIWLGRVASSSALILMGLLVSYEVFSRAVLHNSTLFADEMAGYLLVMLLFMGLANNLRTGGLLRVEFLFNRMSMRNRLIVELISSLLAISFMIILTYQCGKLAWESYDMGYTSVQPSAIHLWIPQSVMPVGCALMVLEFAANLSRLFKELVQSPYERAIK